MGRCGKTEREAALTSWTEYRHLVRGKDDEQRSEWERTRWLAWRLSIVHYKKGMAPGSAKDYWPFPWEKAEEEARMRDKAAQWTPPTADELAALDKIIEPKNKQQ